MLPAQPGPHRRARSRRPPPRRSSDSPPALRRTAVAALPAPPPRPHSLSHRCSCSAPAMGSRCVPRRRPARSRGRPGSTPRSAAQAARRPPPPTRTDSTQKGGFGDSCHQSDLTLKARPSDWLSSTFQLNHAHGTEFKSSLHSSR